MSTVKQFDNFVRNIEKSTIYIAIVFTFAITYYINPLANVELTEWNRTFCSATMAGISIDIRIANFYKLFFLYMPILLTVSLGVLTVLFKFRESHKVIFSKFSVFIFVTTIASFISRYSSDYNEVNDNPMLKCILIFMLMLIIVSFIDKKNKICFKEAVLVFITYAIFVIVSKILFQAKDDIMWCCAVVVVLVLFVMLYFDVGEKISSYLKVLVCLLMWLPAIIRVALEGIYVLTEHGRGIERYFTHLSRVSFVVIGVALLLAWLIRKKNRDIILFGYVGAIISFTAISHFSFGYQYTFSYFNMANIYELGNDAVAMDTYLYGKVPIIDYFSAHALEDVLTQLIYCFLNGDINGILVDPYGGLSIMVASVILFFIIKGIFDEDIAVLYILLFPGLLGRVKWAGVCSIAIAMLIYILKKPSIRAYLFFWVCVLIGAFYTYDEGISLGGGCILALCVGCILQKEWAKFKNFIFVGIAVGASTLAFYFCYALVTGIPIIGRIREWMSVSVGSSSSWATADFGNQTTFAFLLSYFIVPIVTIMIMIGVIWGYIKSRKNYELVVITMAFSFAQILYIPRTIVYHNLAVCSGVTGVLLNFIHWTISMYVLYVVTEYKKSNIVKLFAFSGTMILVFLIEGTTVTGIMPMEDSSLLSRSIKASDAWDITDNVTYNKEKERIIYDKDTANLVNSFRNIFDTLMDENQTFLDFANVTSLYLMTGRKRPCYVGQSPSLLTNLYSQECFLEEIHEYDCPLAVLGTTETSYLQQMLGVPHNIRYYKIAEYIYNNYRPLVGFGEFVIWCKNDIYNECFEKVAKQGLEDNEYTLVDFGYDFTTEYTDEDGNVQFTFVPYHLLHLQDIPYIWANYDCYGASDNKLLLEIPCIGNNKYEFDGSQNYVNDNGNYLAFRLTNITDNDKSTNLLFYDSNNEGAKSQYWFNVKPGENSYLIRISGDYFWDIFNVDTVLFGCDESVEVKNVRILEGD